MGSADVTGRIVGAFPRALATDVKAVARVLPESLHAPSADDIGPLVFRGEPLHIPVRVYFPDPWLGFLEPLSESQRLIADCLFTRHHDGYVRERSIARVLTHSEDWTAPFAIQLVGEYVIEIIRVLQAGIEERHRSPYSEFLADNPEFWRRIGSRVTSYWNCYYRSDYPSRHDYPGTILYKQLENWRLARAAT